MRVNMKVWSLLWVAVLSACASAPKQATPEADPYARYVWPPPPDEAKIRLVTILSGRADVEAESKWKRALIGASPHAVFDFLRKPFAAVFDAQGRLWVSDPGLHALVRFDRQNRRYDVFGTTGSLRLKTPLGLGLGPDGTVYVADADLKRVLAYGPEGELKTAYGKPGELENPTDAAVSPDGKKLYVTDSKAHRVVIFEAATGRVVGSFGERGSGEGQFSFPSALCFDAEGHLFVVDQINARVQVFDSDGTFLQVIGGLGVGFGNFVRPKDVAVDNQGRLYVSDAAFNNVQIFDRELRLLTFVGETGEQPGQFRIASGIAVRPGEFAVVDQLGRRVQLFRYLPTTGE